MASPPHLIALGKVVREWGIKGQIRFRSYNPESDLYPSLKKIYLERPAGWEPLRIEEVRRHGADWLFKLKGFENPEACRELRGHQLGIPRDELPKLKLGEVYVADLVGLEVCDFQGRRIGQVRGVLPVGETEVLVIERSSGEEAMVPFHEQFLESVEMKRKKIILNHNADELLKV